MALIEELQKLQQESEPQTLNDLFAQSKVEMLYERLIDAINRLLPGMRTHLLNEARNAITEEIKNQISGIRIKDGRDGKDGQTPTKDELLTLIKKVLPEPQKEEKKELTVEGINGLRDILNNLSSRISAIPNKRGGGGDTIIADDLSSQADGITQTFTTTKKIGKPILVVSSQFPQVLRLTTDFTASGLTLTIDSAISPIQSGQTLYFVYAEG